MEAENDHPSSEEILKDSMHLWYMASRQVTEKKGDITAGADYFFFIVPSRGEVEGYYIRVAGQNLTSGSGTFKTLGKPVDNWIKSQVQQGKKVDFMGLDDEMFMTNGEQYFKVRLESDYDQPGIDICEEMQGMDAYTFGHLGNPSVHCIQGNQYWSAVSRKAFTSGGAGVIKGPNTISETFVGEKYCQKHGQLFSVQAKDGNLQLYRAKNMGLGNKDKVFAIKIVSQKFSGTIPGVISSEIGSLDSQWPAEPVNYPPGSVVKKILSSSSEWARSTEKTISTSVMVGVKVGAQGSIFSAEVNTSISYTSTLKTTTSESIGIQKTTEQEFHQLADKDQSFWIPHIFRAGKDTGIELPGGQWTDVGEKPDPITPIPPME